MDALDRQTRLAASLESLGEQRRVAVYDPDLPIDLARYAAAAKVIGSAVDAAGRKALADAIPARKASLDLADLDLLILLTAELLYDAQIATGKAEFATKGMWLVRDPYDAHQAAADNLRAVIEAEARDTARKAQRDADAAWVARWSEYGARRVKLVAYLAREMAR